jgi:YD repeat-containing protein
LAGLASAAPTSASQLPLSCALQGDVSGPYGAGLLFEATDTYYFDGTGTCSVASDGLEINETPAEISVSETHKRFLCVADPWPSLTGSLRLPELGRSLEIRVDPYVQGKTNPAVIYATGSDSGKAAGALTVGPKGWGINGACNYSGVATFALEWDASVPPCDVAECADIGNLPSHGGMLEDYSYQYHELPDGTEARVNVANGNLLVSDTDISLPAEGVDLVVDRYYNDRVLQGGAFGKGWTMGPGQDIQLRTQPDGSQEFRGPSGYRVVFARRLDGSYVTPPGLDATLEANGTGGHRLFLAGADATLAFDDSGRLQSWEPAGGPTVTLSYGEGRLQAINGPAGKSLSLSYNATGQVTRITLPDGSAHTYGYDSAGYLISHTDPVEGTTRYEYQDGNLTRITHPNGQDTWIVYDSNRRVTSVNPAGAAHGSGYNYYSGQTAVFEETMPTMLYRYDDSFFVTSSTSGATPPSLSLGGSLNAMAGQTLDPAGIYDLQMNAADASGIRDIMVLLDDVVVDDEQCSTGCGSTAATYTLSAEELNAEDYVVTVIATDSTGEQRRTSFRIAVGRAPAPPDPAEEDPPPTEAETLDRAEQFRQEFGLRSDEAFIRQTYDDPALAGSIDDYGIPLTVAEQADMESRLAVQDQLDVIDDYGQGSAPETYAGVYLDQLQGGAVYVGFTQDVASHMQALRNLFPYPDALHSFTADQTLVQLEALSDRVEADIPDLEASGVPVESISTDLPQNRVEVAVPDPDPAMQAELDSRYGSDVELTQGQVELAHRNFYKRPLWAGLFINIPGYLRFGCTNDFSARRQIDTVGGTPVYAYFTLTAGHCHELTDVWQQGGERIGRLKQHTFTNGSNVDSANIKLDDSDDATRKLFITRDSYRRVTAQAGSHVGDFVCGSMGRQNLVLCGKVRDTDFRANYAAEGVVIRHQVLATPDPKAGDSGSPMYGTAGPGRAKAMGILSGKATTSDGKVFTIYSPIARAENQLNLQILK